MGLLILYFSLAIGVSFLCSILESILLSLNLSYVSVIEKKNPKAGKNLRILKEDINKSIASILILNTIANTLGASGVGAEAAHIFGGDEAVFISSAILTFMILFFSEIIPKTIGAIYWKELSPMAGYIIKFFIFITYPIIILTQFITDRISKNRDVNVPTKEELLQTTLLSENKGVIDEQESDVIENVLSLDEIKVNSILTPRSVVFAIDKNLTIEEILENEDLYRFSRIPVYDGTIDNIIGIVLTKKLFEVAIHNKNKKVEEITQKVFKINENIPVSKALNLFIKRKEHMFIVMDNYDQTEGIVTLEDCIETLLGVEIMDEFDTTEDMQELAKRRMKEKRKKAKKNYKGKI